MDNPKFTKRQYIAIASVFKHNRPLDSWNANKRVQFNVLLKDMVLLMRDDNPRFDVDKFLAAVGGYAAE
jgi:hypothetical protein